MRFESSEAKVFDSSATVIGSYDGSNTASGAVFEEDPNDLEAIATQCKLDLKKKKFDVNLDDRVLKPDESGKGQRKFKYIEDIRKKVRKTNQALKAKDDREYLQSMMKDQAKQRKYAQEKNVILDQ